MHRNVVLGWGFEMSLRLSRTELSEDSVHDSGRQKNFSIGDRQRGVFSDGMIKRFDQILHAGLHVEVPCQKSPAICDRASEILLGSSHRRDEVFEVALKSGPPKLNQGFMILIKDKTVCRTVNPKLMERWTHLRRESEIGCGAPFFTDDDSQLIDDFGFAHTSEKWTHKPMSDYVGRVACQVLGDPGDTMADNILQQFPRQPADPVALVAEKRSRVPGFSKLIAVITLHVHRLAAQKAALDKTSHTSRCVPELIVMAYGDLQSPLLRDRNQSSGFPLVNCEWLLHVDVASPFQAKLGKFEMAFRRGGDVNNIWPGFTEKFCQVAKVPPDREPLVQLAGHQRLPVTDPNDLAPRNPLDLRGMRVCDPAASHNGNLKHVARSPCSIGNNASILLT